MPPRTHQFIDTAGLVHTGAYRDGASIPKFCATSNKPDLSRENEYKVPPLPRKLFVINSFWERENILLQ